ncbi:sensor histidine kinase [Reichenbachiella ulvae]|uniref:Histidine kinase n=1 Tax=Reichenbachiella ulvae TaxID=2980104 RepID=A0ABT3CTA6_9BACT|nr:histidine kinase [Reichenbachiella ulvae]MCV9386867.1 histidine kinase [Reichenbachiella ulvae]
MKLTITQKSLRKLYIAGAALLAIPLMVLGVWIIVSTENHLTLVIETPFETLLFVLYILLALFMLSVLGYRLMMRVRSLLSLRNEKLRMEQQHLQNQISPHFFFNVLNNLYGLIEKQPQKAKEMVLTLSDMMRYSIYEGQKDEVTLLEEKTFIEKFIHLNLSRYRKTIRINFEADLADEQSKITPLLFIILVENAFKHGVEKLTEQAFVDINMKSTDSEVYFSISNNFDPDEPSANGGVGLANLRRRLELVYPKKHQLDIEKSDTTFTVQFRLSLA